ncbi:MAG: polysaccharide deacetylase family protein [Tepidanaerobacteraceae bacterium]|jgi:peptidoglycan/xylan/chitin deacetylase (PgdA/CDA1 family)|nr:polysaccharide deacetylase family protein [Tepidanaerobacteraceae bacterium]
MKQYIFRIIFILLIVTSIVGCNSEKINSHEEKIKEKADKSQEIVRYEKDKCKAIQSVYTARKELALTFNGMADKETMERLLDELDAYRIKATFFLPGMRVAEEPYIAREILGRGHEIENNTLNRLDLTGLTYEQIYKEIKLCNDVIKRETGVTPHYVRTKSGDYNEDVLLAAAHAGMEAVVSYNINPQDWDMKDAKAIGEYVERFICRGGIIALNTDINPEIIPAIRYIARAADNIGYKLIPLEQLIKSGGERKPLEEIPGYDAAKINPDYKNAKYRLIYKASTDKKEIALTFDDWASDKTVTRILDILDKYDVKATFFLRAKGVESNPNLARAIVEGGHDVANHSYAHLDVTSMTPRELQEDIVKAHQVLTGAIQQKPTMLFRPPTGVINDTAARAIAAAGYPVIVMYDVTALDWDTKKSAEDIVSDILKQTQDGSVILLHILDGTNTVEALPKVLEKLKRKGYNFVKMADLFKLKQ